MPYRWCVVPLCKNTSISTPNKVFVSVPRNEKRRRMWLKAIRRDESKKTLSMKTSFYVCEDHFDMENDMDNFMEFKMAGVLLRCKKNIVPHIFDCQPRKFAQSLKPRSYVNKKKKTEALREAINSSYCEMSEDIPAKQRILKRIAVPSVNLPLAAAANDISKRRPKVGRKLANSSPAVNGTLNSAPQSERKCVESERKGMPHCPNILRRRSSGPKVPEPEMRVPWHVQSSVIESPVELSQPVVGLQFLEAVTANIKQEDSGSYIAYPGNLSDEEVITDDIPSQEMLMPVPVKLVEVSTGKEIHFNEPIHRFPVEEDKDIEEEEESVIIEKEEESIFEPKIVLIQQKVDDEDYVPSTSEDEDEDYL